MLPKNGIGAEIGVWKGDFSERILAGATPKKLYLIDPWIVRDDPAHRNAWYGTDRRADIDGIYESVLQRFAKQRENGSVVVKRACSEETLSEFADGFFDFVYIDGDHEYQAVRGDCFMAFDKVRLGGFICGDDYSKGGWWRDGVVRAFHELISERNVIIRFVKGRQIVLQKLGDGDGARPVQISGPETGSDLGSAERGGATRQPNRSRAGRSARRLLARFSKKFRGTQHSGPQPKLAIAALRGAQRQPENRQHAACMPVPDPRASDARRVRNQLEIQAFGLRRSGNHGVIAWIAQQYREPIVFLNCVRPFEDPFTTFLMGRVPNAIPIHKLAPAEAEALRVASKILLLVSYEDMRLPKLAGAELVPKRDEWLGISEGIRRLLLVRDFYNWIASRVRLFEKKGLATDRLLCRIEPHVRLWLVYAREFVGETNYLGSSGVVRISFNDWLASESYRVQILASLGVPLSNNSRLVVPRVGGGSSFDGVLYSGSPEAMGLLERWKYLEDPRHLAILRLLGEQREEIDRYNRQIFGLSNPFGNC